MRLLPRPRADSLLARLHSPSYLYWQVVTGRLWLVAFVVAPLLQGRALAAWLLPTVLSLPVYLYLHTRIYVGPYRRLPWYAAGMVALGLALLPCNDLAWGYLFSAGICFANLQSWRRWLGGVALMAIPWRWWRHGCGCRPGCCWPCWRCCCCPVSGISSA